MPDKYRVKIKCTTFFDVTRTGINTRRQEFNVVDPNYNLKRSQQSNFETILQIVGLRSQPEEVTYPEKTMTLLSKMKMGNRYESKIKIPVWHFTFEVSQDDVFSDESSPLGKLVQDCDSVPMITGLTEWNKMIQKLDTTAEFRNIYFEVIDNEPNDQ